MGSCPFLHKSSPSIPKAVLTANLSSNLSTSEKQFLSLMFKELCIRNNSKSELEKTTFFLLIPFKGLFGESLFTYFCKGTNYSLSEDDFLILFEKFLSTDQINVAEEIFKICDINNTNQLTIEDVILNLFHIIKEVEIDKNKNFINYETNQDGETIKEGMSVQKRTLELIQSHFERNSGKIGKMEFIHFLIEIKAVDIIKEKFKKRIWKYETWKDQPKISKNSETIKIKVFIRGKIREKNLVVSKNFLLLFDKKFTLSNVYLLSGCYIKIEDNSILLHYLTHFEERVSLFFGSIGDSLNFAEILNKEIKPRKFREFYSKGKKIGYGRFSKVFLVNELLTGKKWVVKVVKKKTLDLTEREMMHNEINILSCLSHKGIIMLKDVFDCKKNVKIVLEYVDGTDFLKKIQSKPVKEDEVKRDMMNLFGILKYIHSEGIMHRDLKPENILVKQVEDDYELKVVDFGLSAYYRVKNFRKVQCGTLLYTAPEVFSDEYNEKSDVWSLGVITYFYLTGKFPFFDESKEELKDLIEKYEPNFENEDWENYSEEAKNFCFCLLCKASESRPSCEAALNHKWFQIAS